MSDENSLEYVVACIDYEGFDYTFMHYDTFKKVEDKRFHNLRKAYLEARKNLANYLKEQVSEFDDS